jgi:aminoglycoside phosphotransferase (APT) family kinase protein
MQVAWLGALRGWLASQGVAVRDVTGARKLSGGAIQENWALDLQLESGMLPVVLRIDAPSGVGESWGRAEEFALLRVAHGAGVTVPEPLWLCDASLLGRPFFIMRRVGGTAAGHVLVKDRTLGGDREALVRRIGAEMARLHRVSPPQPSLAFLPVPQRTPVQESIAGWRAFLDRQTARYPLLEWGLRWLERHEPSPLPLVLAHRDFRTGNFMADTQGLTAVLDWEFAGWSDPREDLGWFCARCWRFGQTGPGYEAGGLGSRQALLAGYADAGGLRIDEAELHYWEVHAHLRWAMIALAQGERHESGREPSLELALTAHIVPELEVTLLAMTSPAMKRDVA